MTFPLVVTGVKAGKAPGSGRLKGRHAPPSLSCPLPPVSSVAGDSVVFEGEARLSLRPGGQAERP